MRRSILTGLLALGAFTVSAQQDPSWEPVFRKINDEVQQHSKAYSTLKDATETIGHRLTGSENGKKAETYAFNLLKSYGFTDIQYQPFEVESWSRGQLAVSAGSKSNLQPVKSVSLAHSPVKVDLTAELVDMGNGLDSDYVAKPGIAKDKIALVYLGTLPGTTGRSLHRSEKTAIAIKYGAKGIIVINTVDGGTLLTGTASVTGKLIPIPAVCIGKEDGMRLKEQLKTGALFSRINMTNFSGKIKARNVIATIKGSSLPQEKIVVGGHLDSWDLATGAIDNGIGSFSVLDMARTFQQLQLKPKRTIQFVMFMGEEQGLLGSKAFVHEAIKNKQIDQLRYMLNFDMTGDVRGFSSSAPEAQPLFQAIGSIAQQIDTVFTNSFSSRAGLHSDHQPFMLQGVPTGGGGGGRGANGPAGCYHADCDVFSLVNSEQGMKNTVKFVSMLLYGLGTADSIPAKKLSDEETKQFLLKHNLKEPLQLEGEWRWKD
ncbi:M20/M25/M40 family metallo-hydrolase [Paraflavitalea sp. CAU 1676]|uniref:M20/M25/M40 family metallo-hydrolase n=1 Tax=Paraflavitalea sp. CAU 1676 TaxID=3032598 RepID=UPI0023D9F35D|nr:M20/M25/M40 family metallo-hydrolase [Paraflavitalea sp. CAU 1676]MDF2191453.1 M20/M25/M40 family metallo-hydrolase [Paraflavitalea sp. CAU 1676]